MPLYSVSSRLAQASPTVSVEKGAYRMRAPYTHTHTHTRSASTLHLPRKVRFATPPRSAYRKQMALLVVFLVSAAVSCFGVAYYLFSTRWDTRALHSLPGDPSDDLPSLLLPQALDFGSDLRDAWPTSASSYPSFTSSDGLVLSVDPDERFMAYLPHSGFHNQRIAFENALVLSRLLNRTLLVPPVRLGNRPLYYLPFDELREYIANSSKHGLQHCRHLPPDPLEVPECDGYFDFTYVPWSGLVDLTQIKSEQRLLPCSNLTAAWLEEWLHIGDNDTFALKDLSRNQYRFQDFTTAPGTMSLKYLESVQISSLAARPERLLFLGTLFGSSRLHLRDPANYRLRKRIRENMAFTNPLLTQAAESISAALGGQYLGAHVRVGDGPFLENAGENVRLIWWRLVHSILGFSMRDTLALEKGLLFDQSDPEDALLIPPRIPLDFAALRAPHPDLPPLDRMQPPALICPRELHAAAELQPLNTPLFISTDVSSPSTDLLLRRFVETFPCMFLLGDFPSTTSVLDGLENADDGVRLRPFFMPVLDAMVAARAWQVVGTEQSTFSAFVQDVLWRTYHGYEIVQRG
ncbi:uncharacterized protein LAESUDRAFT_175031 [Laetiporus sulphureus 93-53]|uniref:CigA protein n=1 Tax=Laetiporus sulphureus 93-53 TaxID=1314785 RepID=A0A165HX80_9APHY|nr:uncharacterized protein LAESUDRAFT_175031 [Laetiporus sulphureus 93-53]KZT12308.1 hypothetical protein LAESUDRAFT_175031 [Laetiporus sulphureus 93-53]